MRRLRVFIDHLPPDSATKTRIRDGMTVEQWESLPPATGWGAWSHTDHLLALIADRVAWLEWTFQAQNAEKGKIPKHPEPISRPGVGRGPIGAVADTERREHLVRVARLKAIQALGGAEPTEEQIQEVLDELTGGD